MPAVFVPVPLAAQVEMRFTQQGQKVENVFHVSTPLGPVPADYDTIGGLFASWFTATQASEVSNGLTLHSVIVRDMAVQNGLAVEHTTGLPASGLDASAQPPMNVTLAVKWVTGLSGRSFRGRTFHLGVVNTQFANSTANGALITSLHNTYNLLRTNLASAGFPLVVVSKFSNKLPRVAGLKTLITDNAIDSTMDSQRRRLPGRGQ
jgi:hypothetical protein